MCAPITSKIVTTVANIVLHSQMKMIPLMTKSETIYLAIAWIDVLILLKRRECSTRSVTSSIYDYETSHGRTYHAVSYMKPSSSQS